MRSLIKIVRLTQSHAGMHGHGLHMAALNYLIGSSNSPGEVHNVENTECLCG